MNTQTSATMTGCTASHGAIPRCRISNDRVPAFGCLMLMLLSGCAVGPDYRRPEFPVPSHYRESLTESLSEPEQFTRELVAKLPRPAARSPHGEGATIEPRSAHRRDSGARGACVAQRGECGLLAHRGCFRRLYTAPHQYEWPHRTSPRAWSPAGGDRSLPSRARCHLRSSISLGARAAPSRPRKRRSAPPKKTAAMCSSRCSARWA